VEAVRGASRDEVKAHMEAIGFQHIANTDDYHNPISGIRVEDLHDENVLVSAEGDLYIVDPVVYLDDEGKRHRLAANEELDQLAVA